MAGTSGLNGVAQGFVALAAGDTPASSAKVGSFDDTNNGVVDARSFATFEADSMSVVLLTETFVG
jgi:hypothetical protein